MMAATWFAISRGAGVALISALTISLAGCSTIQDFSGVLRPGYQKDGSYVLSSQEQGLGCRDLEERSLGLQEQMQKLPEQAVEQMQKLPDTIVAAWGRLVGSPGDAPAMAEYNDARTG